MMRRDRRVGIKELKCTNLTFEFVESQDMENFEKRLLYLRYQWAKLDRERRSFHRKNKDRKMSSSTSSSTSFVRLPAVQTIEEEEWRELEAEMQTRELDSVSLEGVYELPENGDSENQDARNNRRDNVAPVVSPVVEREPVSPQSPTPAPTLPGNQQGVRPHPRDRQRDPFQFTLNRQWADRRR